MKIFKNLILIILIIGTFFVIKDIYKEGTIRLVRFKSENEIMLENDFYIKSDITNIMKNDEYKENNINKKTSIVLDVPKKYFGYEVDGILKIPKIKLETYIFKEYSEEAMNIAPTKLWGPKINEYGNYSIIGHNYKKENMFSNLIDLEINDSIYLIDNENGEIEYRVYDIYKVKENNIDPIKQKTKEEIELTLITCVNYTNSRLIVKAKKI